MHFALHQTNVVGKSGFAAHYIYAKFFSYRDLFCSYEYFALLNNKSISETSMILKSLLMQTWFFVNAMLSVHESNIQSACPGLLISFEIDFWARIFEYWPPAYWLFPVVEFRAKKPTTFGTRLHYIYKIRKTIFCNI